MENSKHFSKKELQCKHTGKCNMDSVFMGMLETLREDYGKPMIITSGYRDITHPEEASKNKKEGALPSDHTIGAAVDISCSLSQAKQILTLALNIGFTRVGIKQHGPFNGRFLHLCYRTDKSEIIFSYS